MDVPCVCPTEDSDGSASRASRARIVQGEDSLELETVLAVSEAIAGEIDSGRLIETLLRIALEHAGAERGMLFLRGDKGMAFQAQAEVFGGDIQIMQRDSATPEVAAPTAVLDVVERSMHSVVLEDAARIGCYTNEAYFQSRGTRSVLCLPLVKGTLLSGILYLDNNAIPGAFTHKRIAVLRLVAAQAAIALENSHLYLQLKRENRERQLAEEAMHQATRALRESEERFRAMGDATQDVIRISEADPERVLYVNPSFERIWGVSMASLYANAHVWIDGIHPDDRHCVQTAFGAWVKSDGATTWDVKFRILQPEGGVRWLHERGVFLSTETGSPRRIGGIASDVTDQHIAELALKRSEERHALAMEAARDGHWDWIADTDEYYASPRMLEIYGFPPDTRFNGRQDFLARFPFHPEDAPRWKTAFSEHVASGKSHFDMELRLFRNNEMRWVRLNGLLSRDSEGRPIRYTGSVSDVTERKAADAALRESEQRFALATEGSSDGIYDWDMSSNLLFLSHKAQQLYGLVPAEPIRSRADWVGRIRIHPEDAPRQRQLLDDYLAGKIPVYDGEWRVQHQDGAYRWIRIRGVCLRDALQRATRVAGSVSDIDAQRRAESAMQHMQRLEAVGTLAGGVAHDFNNILAVILGFGEAAITHTRTGSRMRRDLERILSAGERGRALVERILAFSRSSAGARVVVNLESVIDVSVAMIDAMCPANVKLEVQLTAGLATLIGDPTQVHQLLMNLATNAMQAMPAGGTLGISLSCVELAREHVVTTGAIPCGEYALLRVSDSGTGIAASIREKIFDPFFTTKEVGTGTGLGLSLVHGIVTELGGGIDVATEVDVGSTFCIYLPRGGEYAEKRDEKPKPHAKPPARGKKQQILVVDDEEALAQLNSSVLAELGYRSTAFTSPLEALKALRLEPASFDAVLTDLRMPQMSGLALIAAARALRPGIPMLPVSGFLGGTAATQAREAGADIILNKPLARRDLARALSQAFGGKCRPAQAVQGETSS